MLELDGAMGEGGGQILRTALALSAITGRAFRVVRIRARRPEPGLRPQHLAAVRAMAAICAAEVEGDDVGSRELTFIPQGPPRSGTYRFDVGTAGSVGLIFQTVFLPLALADGPSTVILTGGTHVPWSPPVHYLDAVYLPVVRELGWQAELELVRWGWYPRGGGELRVRIEGGVRREQVRGGEWVERGALKGVEVLSAASCLPSHVRERQAHQAEFRLRKWGIVPRVMGVDAPSVGPGTMVFVCARYGRVTAGFTAYGKLRKPAEKVAEEACRAFWRYHRSGAAVDPWLGDQLLLPLAVAGKPARYTAEITGHLETQAMLIGQFLDVPIAIQRVQDRIGEVLVACSS